MHELSIYKHIESRIRKGGGGAILFDSDFADLGNKEVVKKGVATTGKTRHAATTAFQALSNANKRTNFN